MSGPWRTSPSGLEMRWRIGEVSGRRHRDPQRSAEEADLSFSE